jgi:hypothetical protein
MKVKFGAPTDLREESTQTSKGLIPRGQPSARISLVANW